MFEMGRYPMIGRITSIQVGHGTQNEDLFLDFNHFPVCCVTVYDETVR